MTELHNDHAQIANNEGAYIPMEDVDAALRRIEKGLERIAEWHSDCGRDDCEECLICNLHDAIYEERERQGLTKEVKA